MVDCLVISFFLSLKLTLFVLQPPKPQVELALVDLMLNNISADATYEDLVNTFHLEGMFHQEEIEPVRRK